MSTYKVYTKRGRPNTKQQIKDCTWGHEVKAKSYSEAKKIISKKIGIPEKKLTAIKIKRSCLDKYKLSIRNVGAFGKQGYNQEWAVVYSYYYEKENRRIVDVWSWHHSKRDAELEIKELKELLKKCDKKTMEKLEC